MDYSILLFYHGERGPHAKAQPSITLPRATGVRMEYVRALPAGMNHLEVGWTAYSHVDLVEIGVCAHNPVRCQTHHSVGPVS